MALSVRSPMALAFFFFNDTATTEIYTLSLHDALPISPSWTDRPPRPRHLQAQAIARESAVHRVPSGSSSRRTQRASMPPPRTTVANREFTPGVSISRCAGRANVQLAATAEDTSTSAEA